ncbi:hypothetical protein BDV95DRAFT_612894 [Massariosphaeria phaeospora]|uniref:Uncharacterized protein n=1 Tax=Massariosphaeria phaeospora TaxID=100035 RepID=A0A7C8HZX0_9PLEO|nr:hypothetical protein BDV95DRAFT_612894 [Massariosphaeria phaeospora]
MSSIVSGIAAPSNLPLDHVNFDLYGATPNQHVFLPKTMYDQMRAGDFSGMIDAEQKQNEDMQPIFDSISEATDNGQPAFNVVTDPQGRQYNLQSTDQGALWILVEQSHAKRDVPAEDQENQTTIINPTVTIGTYSKNAEVSYFSVSSIPGDFEQITALALGAVIGSTMAKWITMPVIERAALEAGLVSAKQKWKDSVKTLNKNPHAEWLEKAEDDAWEELSAVRAKLLPLEDGGAMDAVIGRLAIYPGLVSGVASFSLATAAFIVFDLVWNNFISQDYYLETKVFNFDDKRSWNVSDWYHDNGIVAGSTLWYPTVLPPPVKAMPNPFGGPPIPAEYVSATTVSYLYQNSFTVFDGLGAVMRVATENDPSIGFGMGYDIQRFEDNLIGLSAGPPTDLKVWYHDGSNWAEKGSLNRTIELLDTPEHLNITGVTDALSGAKDNTYRYYVSIGEAKGYVPTPSA